MDKTYRLDRKYTKFMLNKILLNRLSTFKMIQNQIYEITSGNKDNIDTYGVLDNIMYFNRAYALKIISENIENARSIINNKFEENEIIDVTNDNIVFDKDGIFVTNIYGDIAIIKPKNMLITEILSLITNYKIPLQPFLENGITGDDAPIPFKWVYHEYMTLINLYEQVSKYGDDDYFINIGVPNNYVLLDIQNHVVYSTNAEYEVNLNKAVEDLKGYKIQINHLSIK